MIPRRPRAFFIEEPRSNMDMGGCAQHGEPVILCTREQRRPGVMNVRAYAEHILDRLAEEDFDSSIDFIVLTGPVLVLQFAALAAAARFGRIKLLAFNSTMDGYVEREWDSGWFSKERTTGQCRTSMNLI